MSEGPISPCSGVCLLDPRFGWCAGCFRQPQEIRAWPQASPIEKQQILDQLDDREHRAAQKQPWCGEGLNSEGE
jgi:predicted Fe-S protein YdhL (DUF1289 family)